MLLQRVITALILIPPVLAAIWFLPNPALAAVFAVVLLAGAWEWSLLMPLKTPPQRIAYIVAITLVLGLLYLWRDEAGLRLTVLGIAALWWVAALIWVIRYPAGLAPGTSRTRLKAFIGCLVLAPAFLALVLLHARTQGPLWILFLLVLIWIADTGAYFSGRQFGRTKLAPEVSPGKTWEGALGGLMLSTLGAGLAAQWLFGISGVQLLWFVAMCAGVVTFSIVGDLTESMFKRHAGIKDSGTLFPGHGGVLDRLDSLFAAAPLFLGGLTALGI